MPRRSHVVIFDLQEFYEYWHCWGAEARSPAISARFCLHQFLFGGLSHGKAGVALLLHAAADVNVRAEAAGVRAHLPHFALDVGPDVPRLAGGGSVQ